MTVDEIKLLVGLNNEQLILRILESKDIHDALTELLLYKGLDCNKQLIMLDMPLNSDVYYIDWCSKEDKDGKKCTLNCTENQRQSCFDFGCKQYCNILSRKFQIQDNGKLGNTIFESKEDAYIWLERYTDRVVNSGL